MPLSHEEITAIKKEVISECKNIFVQIDECNEKQERMNGRFANDDKRIDLILQNQINYDKKIVLNNKLTVAILGGIITLVFTLIGIIIGG